MNTNTTLNFVINRQEKSATSDSDSPAVPRTSGTTTPVTTTTVTSTPTTFVGVPNTGLNSRISSSKPNSLVNFWPIVFIVFAVALLTAAIYHHKKSHLKFSKGSFQLKRSPIVLSLSATSVLIAAFLASSLFSQGSIDSDLNVSSKSGLALSADSVTTGTIDKYLDVDGLVYSAVTRVAVETSSNYDYHLYMRAESDKLYLNGDKNSNYFFDPVATNGGLNNQDGTWGYHTIQDYVEQYCNEEVGGGEELGSCDTSKYMPTPTTDKEILKSNATTNPFLIFFAANPSDNLPSGTYTTKIIYSLISDEPPTTAMQNWSGCSSLKTGETVSLSDSRDDKEYQVRKLVDGKCWMVDDLAFTKDMTLTPADTSVKTNTSIAFIKNTPSDEDEDKVARYFDHDGHIMYNYYAATAKGSYLGSGSGDEDIIETSICPAGWHLPTGDSEFGEFALLEEAAGGDEAAHNYFRSSAGAAFNMIGFYYPDGGHSSESELTTNSMGTSYWSSTGYNRDYAHELHLYDDGMVTSCSWGKDFSFPVRCVQGSIPTITPDPDPDPDPEPDPEPDPDPDPTPTPDPTCVITSSNPCALKDGKTWIIGHNGGTTTWGGMFSGGNGTANHEGTLKSGICPTGYSAPSITDFDNLIRAYGGEEITEANSRTGYQLHDASLFKLFGGQTNTIAFWSSTEQSAIDAFYFTVSNGSAYSAAHHAKITNYYYAACYKSSE